MNLVFDVCRHFEAGRDFSFGENPNGYSTRSFLTNIQCHAQEKGEVCTRNGRCVIARTEEWDRITKKTWSKSEKKK